MTNWYDNFYDSVMNKYKTKDKKVDDPLMPKPRSYKRMPASIFRDLKRAIEDVRNNSGFNTNAPDYMYESAKSLFKELKERLRDAAAPSADLRFLDKAHYALFDKLDHMEALEFLDKMEVE
jgi:hypothetical protein